MSTSFSRTLRALGADSHRFSFAAALAGASLAALWTGWFLLARVTLYEVTEEARIEVASAASPVQSPIAGRVIRASLEIGRAVTAGEILAELEAESEQLQIREEHARLAGYSAQTAALRAQIAAEERARAEERQAAGVAIEQARAAEREALARAEYSEEESRRLGDLRRENLVAERDFARGKADAERYRAALENARTAVRKIAQEQKTRDSERDTRIRALEAEISKIEGQSRTVGASVNRLRYEVDRRVVRAPVSGTLGEVKILRAGTVVEEGERLAAIVPGGGLRVVAQFPPAAVAGRIRAGQPALMRMHGFPWAQYGAVEATVSRVADEVRDGAVRVELAVNTDGGFRGPVRHGMPGSLEVEVEKIAPAALVMRLAGQWVTQPRGAHQTAARSGAPPAP